jgi:hypothetical protein
MEEWGSRLLIPDLGLLIFRFGAPGPPRHWIVERSAKGHCRGEVDIGVTSLASETLRRERPGAGKLRPSRTLASNGSADQARDGARQSGAPRFA